MTIFHKFILILTLDGTVIMPLLYVMVPIYVIHGLQSVFARILHDFLFQDIKFMLLPWVVAMGLETLVEIVNLVYLFYLQTVSEFI